MVALFRIAPLASGRILIDGIDISTVPLAILRSRLGIIPQVCGGCGVCVWVVWVLWVFIVWWCECVVWVCVVCVYMVC